MLNRRPSPKFSFVLPKNGKFDSAKRVAEQYGLLCEDEQKDCLL